MDAPYRIEVLHIVNPHVMFVESQTQGTPAIQQVGLYGILPLNPTLDIDGNVSACRGSYWPTHAIVELKEFFDKHKNCLYFVPIQVEERSTIFDENTHTFGDIVTKPGKVISITKYFLKINLAIKDERLFHQELTTGALCVKLNSKQKEEVLKAIKKYYKEQEKVEHDWRNMINKQTSVYQESKKMGAALTEDNLRIFQLNMGKKLSVRETIKNKEKDLNLCKDVDLVSVGCGSRRNSSMASSSKSKQSPEKDMYPLQPQDIFKNLKNYVEVNARPKSNCHSNITDDSQIKQFQKKESYEPAIKVDVAKDQRNPDQLRADQKCFSQQQQQTSYKKYSHDTQQTTSPLEYTGSKKEAIASLKPKTRVVVYCPDMVMSTENTKDLVRKTLCDIITDPPKLSSPLEYSNAEINEPHHDDDFVYYDVSSKTNDIDTLKQPACRNNYDTGNQMVSKENTCGNSETRYLSQNFTDLNLLGSLKTVNPNNRFSTIFQKKLELLKESGKSDQNTSVSSNSDLSGKDTPSSIELSDLYVKSITTDEKLSRNVPEQSKKYPEPPKTAPEVSKHVPVTSKDIPEVSKNIPELLNNVPDLPKDVPGLTKKDLKQPITGPERSIHVLEQPKLPQLPQYVDKVRRNVNPFKNLDGSKSVFVEKLVTPVLMVHTKNDCTVIPYCTLRDIPFKQHICSKLATMRIRQPKRLQTVSWNYIMRGHSFFMVSPAGNGKTLGYVPAVCNLVLDSITQTETGPLCIIVCATAFSVSETKKYCDIFLNQDLSNADKVLALHYGMPSKAIVTALLNGCHILITTPSLLVQYLGVDLGVDLRNLMTLVLEDCERLSQVYASELNTILLHVKTNVKMRADKSAKVQYIVASRLWCDFMAPLAKKAPDTIIAIGASQECVLYSKTQTSVNYVTSQSNKVNAVIEFLKEIDGAKRTVIVCRADDEVTSLACTLTALKYFVFSCNSTMTLQDLYNLNGAWSNYQEPILGPILICCDSNLPYLNVTDASYLIHFSLPALFSMFCKRFLVLNEKYASIFEQENKDVKVKIFLDETNVEQLPKILHFIKRCTKEVFPMLDNVIQQVLEDKDLKKAKAHAPICNTLLMLGECADEWNCNDRHTIFKEFDEPKEWMPKQGIVKFLIMCVNSPDTYTARVTGKIIKSKYTEYPNNYRTLRFDMQRYYTRETNRKLHGIPKVGDICAANTKLNSFERCKVVEVIPGDDKRSYYVRIYLIDELQCIVMKDIHLYHLPDNFKVVETYVVQIRLANIKPKDNDITYSCLTKEHIDSFRNNRENKITYMKGPVLMSLNECIFVDEIDACIDLAEEDGGTVVKVSFKRDKLNQLAVPNPQHIEKLRKLSNMLDPVDEEPDSECSKRVPKNPRWAHFDNDDFLTVHATAVNPSTLFVFQTKFLKVVDLLINDIKEYVKITPELIQEEVYVGNIVLAEYPDDNVCERARIDEIVDDKIVKCFFVDSGDRRQVSVNKLWPITDKIMQSVPFQAIECRLVGVKPPGDDWPETSTDWLYENCFKDQNGDEKALYAKYFIKEKATLTGGHKYGIVLIDTYSDQDVVVNEMMIKLNLAVKNEDESKYIDVSLKTSVNPELVTNSLSREDDSFEMNNSHVVEAPIVKDLVPFQHKENENDEKDDDVLRQILFEKPIRSVPLIADDDSDIDRWDISDEFPAMFGLPPLSQLTKHESGNVTVKEISNSSEKLMIDAKSENDAVSNEFSNSNKQVEVVNSNCSESISSVIKTEERVAEQTLSEIENVAKKVNKSVTLDSDDFSSEMSEYKKPEAVKNISKITEVVDPPRTPKLVWRQNKKTVVLKIILIGVEDYSLEIKGRLIEFSTRHHETTYKFDFELYGVVKPEDTVHSSKGQYIQVTLVKMLQRNWLSLTRDCTIKKWIVYDVDAIDLSSDEDDDDNIEALEAIKYSHNKVESDSEDENFADDVNFQYLLH